MTKELVKNISNNLKDSGWYDALRIYLGSYEFEDILIELKRKVDEEQQRFTPALKYAFKFMEMVPVDKIKAVILVDYQPNKLVQDGGGIALQRPKGIPYTEIPLSYITISLGKKIEAIEWVKQGVLIIPLALTSRLEGKPHKKLWQPFIMRLIEIVNKQNKEAPWVLMGGDTWKYEDDVISPHTRKVKLVPGMDKDWAEWVNSVVKEPISW